MIRKNFLKAFGTLALLFVSGFLCADSESPPVVAVCEGCHGDDGVSVNPLVPTLAGQPYTLIEDNLLAFRAGLRVCKPGQGDNSPAAILAQVMCTNVAGLDDLTIAETSGYFSGKTFKAARQSFDPEFVALGSQLHDEKGCEHCHAGGGSETQDMAPVLAGQWSPYLRRAMNAFRSQTRKGPTVMNAAIRQMTDSDIEALLQFYASQPEAR